MADTRQDRPRVLSKWDKIVKEFYEAVWAVFNLDGTVVIGPASEVPWVVDPIDPVLLRPPTESQRERVILNRATITGINVAKGRGDIGQSDLASIPLAVTIRVDDDVREVATELLLAQIDQIRLLRSVVSGEVESRDGAAFRPIGNLDIVYRTDF